MKSSRVGLQMLVAGFLCVGSFGQGSSDTQTATDSTLEIKDMSTTSTQSATQPESDAVQEATATDSSADSESETTEPSQSTMEQESTSADSESETDESSQSTEEKEAVATDVSDEDTESEAEVESESVSDTEPVAAEANDDTTKESTADKNVIELQNEVVVGYGIMKKDDLTGSVTPIKPEDLAKSAVYSVRKALQGKAAGVTVTSNSGQPGKAVTVRVRGVGTINNSDPLYVVDGMPVKSIDYLNPSDIESMVILKDASATAIYGSRGANGVILVTTKKAMSTTEDGKEGGRVINYDMSFGSSKPWREPDMCNAGEWATLRNEAMEAAGLPPDATGISGEGTNWFKEVTREHAYMQSQNVSIAHANDRLKYFISGGLLNQEGIVKKSDFDKIMLRFNAEQKVTNWLTLGNNIGIGQSDIVYTNEQDEHNSTIILALSMDPATKVRDSEGNYVSSNFNNVKNPVARSEYYDINAKHTSFTGLVYSTIDLMEDLQFKTSFSMDRMYKDSTEFISKYDIGGDDSRGDASLTRRTGIDNTLIFENTLTYDANFLDDHTLKLLGGTTHQNREWDSVFAANSQTASNDSSFRYLNATQGTSPNVAGVAGGNSLASFFGRAEYEFVNRYLLTATYRADGSSRFAEKNRWGYFPSVAAAWKISNEKFMSGVTFVEGLKLRAGWGKTGNQEIGDYLFLTTENGKQQYVLNNEIVEGTAALSKGNDEIHWEKQVATNVGLDVNLFGGRIEFISDFYIKQTNDMLVSPPIPQMSGIHNPPIVNLGKVRNTGGEFVLNYREAIGDFKSNVALNFSRYVNEVLDLGGNDIPIKDCTVRNNGKVTQTEVGHPIGSFYGRVTDGLFQTQAEIDAYVDKDGKKIQPDAKPGDIKFVYDEKEGALLEDYIGSPHPDFTAGMNVDLTYKEFDFSLGLFVSYGNEIFNGVRWYTDHPSGMYGLSSRMLDRWTPSNPHNDVTTPRMNADDKDNIKWSDRYVEDGSYLRVKTMQLGYSFNSKLLNKIKIKKCRVYVGAENLLTFTKYSGLDPEIGLNAQDGFISNAALSMGVDRGTYPQARTYMVGLNLTL